MLSNIPKSNTQDQFWKGIVVIVFLLVTLAWLINTPAGILGKAEAIGYAVCHRIDLRSFHIGGMQLPLCARCSGMYLGAMVGLFYQWVTGRRRTGVPSWQIILVISIYALLFAIDGLNSFVSLISSTSGLYPPNNALRLLTGTGMGLTISIALAPAFNATIWRLIDPRPAFLNLRSFVVLVLIALGMDALILTENPMILYPLALISSVGVLVILTMVYTMILIMVFKSENRYNQFSQLFFAVLGGLTVALIQIGLLDIIRYAFTGTWDGFHI
jgi:uncharacterized membrane protein